MRDNKKQDYINLMFSGNKVKAIVVTTLASLTIIGGLILLLQYVSRLKQVSSKQEVSLYLGADSDGVGAEKLIDDCDIRLMVSSIEFIVGCSAIEAKTLVKEINQADLGAGDDYEQTHYDRSGLTEHINQADLGAGDDYEQNHYDISAFVLIYKDKVEAMSLLKKDFGVEITAGEFKSAMSIEDNWFEDRLGHSFNQKLLALVPIDHCVMLASNIKAYKVQEQSEYKKYINKLEGTWLEQSSDTVVKDFMAKCQFLKDKGLHHGLETAMGGGVGGKPDVGVFPIPGTFQIRGSFGALEPSFEKSIYGRVSHIYEKYQLAKGMMLKAGLSDDEASDYLKEDTVWQSGRSVVSMGDGKCIADLIKERIDAFLPESLQSQSGEGIDKYAVAAEVLDHIKGVEPEPDEENRMVYSR